MGKHAFLLGVYVNPDYTDAIINQLLSDKTNIYVHVNDLNWADFIPLAKKYENSNNVMFMHDVKVLWGGSTLQQSIMCMLGRALENKENSYFHLITGQDILIKPLDVLFKFFENNINSYISYFTLPDSKRFAGGGLERYDYYQFYDLLDCRKKRGINAKLNKLSILTQKIFHFKRSKLPFKQIYGGSGWWSLQRDAAEYVYKEWFSKKLYRRLAHTFAPDEMIVMTLLLNSDKQFPVVNDNLRFMIWEAGLYGPRNLTIADFDKLKHTNAFFARKMNPVTDADLYHKINKELNKTEQ